MRRILLGVLGLFCFSAGIYAAVTGVVVDSANKPVPDAMITYTNIANRLIYVYSNQNGQFCIPGPTEWSLDDLPMYKSACASSVAPSRFPVTSSSLGMSVKRSTVFISLGEGTHAVTASVYESSGKLVANVLKATLGKGVYAFAPFGGNLRLATRQMYLVRVSDGSHSQTFRMINLGTGNTVTNLPGTVSTQNASLKKVMAVDGIRAGKTGYLPDTVSLTGYDQNVGNVKIQAVDIEKRVDSLLAKMQQNEKLGQLMQPAGCNQSTAQNALLGSYLKGEGDPGPMTGALSTRLKIPLIVGNDVVHGGRHIYFPQEIGLGCTGDTLLVELAYRIYAMCSLPLYNNECFAPCLDVHRSDFSGRVYEGFGETPELTVPFARAAVRGLQGTDLSSGYTMMATLKHWAAAGGTSGGGGHADANTAPNLGVLAQIHFPPFLAGVKAGAAGVMTGYQSVFGTLMAVNKQLVTDTLKNGWGFDGFVITDWATSNGRETDCVNAGHDLCMTVTPGSFPGTIGSVSQSRIDDAVRRLLRVKFRMGLFENPWPNLNLNNYLASPEYRAVARKCVRKSLVLLKNSAVNGKKALPLSKSANVHIVGAWADNMGYQCGGWSATGGTINDNSNVLVNGVDEGWQGSANPHGIKDATTILQAIKGACTGTVTSNNTADNIPSTADVIVVVVGETTYAEDYGDRTDITLNGSCTGNVDQIGLVQNCKNNANGRPVVTILITGRPNVLGSIPDNSSALVAAWLPGTEGEGVTDVIFGDYNFTGKLSVTWPASNSQQPINTGTMGDNVGSGGNPLFAYGFGLTY